MMELIFRRALMLMIVLEIGSPAFSQEVVKAVPFPLDSIRRLALHHPYVIQAIKNNQPVELHLSYIKDTGNGSVSQFYLETLNPGNESNEQITAVYVDVSGSIAPSGIPNASDHVFTREVEAFPSTPEGKARLERLKPTAIYPKFCGNEATILNEPEIMPDVKLLARYLKTNPDVGVDLKGNVGWPQWSQSEPEGEGPQVWNRIVFDSPLYRAQEYTRGMLMLLRAKSIELLLLRLGVGPGQITVSRGTGKSSVSNRKVSVTYRTLEPSQLANDESHLVGASEFIGDVSELKKIHVEFYPWSGSIIDPNKIRSTILQLSSYLKANPDVSLFLAGNTMSSPQEPEKGEEAWRLPLQEHLTESSFNRGQLMIERAQGLELLLLREGVSPNQIKLEKGVNRAGEENEVSVRFIIHSGF